MIIIIIIMIKLCSKCISGQTTGLDHLHAHFHSDSALYPDSDSSLTVVYPKVVLSVVGWTSELASLSVRPGCKTWSLMTVPSANPLPQAKRGLN